jgi:hypothetical protein
LKGVPPLPSLGGPIMHFDFFRSSHFTPSHPNSIVLSSIRLLGWQCNVLPFSWSSIVAKKIDTSGLKNLKGYHPLFTRLFLSQCFSFIEFFFSPFGFHSCIFSSLCSSI